MDFNKMDKETLNQMMLQQIQELENEGVVDENFRECYTLKEYTERSFFLDLISEFLVDVQAGARRMTRTLDQPVVNYTEMKFQGIKLKESALCFGVCPVRDACFSLCGAIDNESKEGCLQALQIINNVYNTLYNRMAIIMRVTSLAICILFHEYTFFPLHPWWFRLLLSRYLQFISLTLFVDPYQFDTLLTLGVD